MSDERAEGEQAQGAEAAAEDAGVLGNLPRTRPSVRSPRRSRPAQRQAAPAAEREESPDEEAPTPTTAPETRQGPEAELEALAKSGIALAGAAAGLGFRVAGRAAAALRDAVERR